MEMLENFYFLYHPLKEFPSRSVNKKQCCGYRSISGSGLDQDSMVFLDPYPDPGGQK
jgi:hypothetical protein